MITDCCSCGSQVSIDLNVESGCYARGEEVKVYKDWCKKHEKCLFIKQAIMLATLPTYKDKKASKEDINSAVTKAYKNGLN